MAGFSGRGARQARGYKTSSDDGYRGLFRDRGAPRASAASGRALEAEEEEKRVRAERAERHDAVLEAERARDRYKAQLEEARARGARRAARSPRPGARDREDDYVKEIVLSGENPEDSAPSGVDLARLELNCAKAALRLGRASDARHATHYGVLGVSPRSDDADVRRAYRKASMRWHPDRQKDGGVARRRARERHFRRINEAKEVLLDSYKRAVYDVEARRRLMDEDDRRGRRRRRGALARAKAFAVTNPPAVAEPPDGARAASPRPESRKSGYAGVGGVRDAETPASPPAKSPPDAPVEREWSARLQKYEDELQRQRDELDRSARARVRVEERDRRDKLADRLEAETNGDEELGASSAGDGDGLFGKGPRDADPATSDDDDDDDDLPSTAGAAGFFAAGGDHLFDDVLDDDDDDMDDDDDDDDDDGGDGGARKDSEDLVAQLRDAAEWFDQLDARPGRWRS
ncbi:hypothetical protein SO694_00008031 [Aureococcus anophagefferens]|uniref:J domain-containing protein n=1 Tax=Aureococcus anophagefferens TaxID=44056 RepID=A0ABR1GDH5_AURAN